MPHIQRNRLLCKRLPKKEIHKHSLLPSESKKTLVIKNTILKIKTIVKYIRNKNPASQGHLQAPRCHTFAKDARGTQGARGVLTARKTDAERPKMAPGSPVGVLALQNDSVASSTVSLYLGRPGRLMPLRQTPMVPDVLQHLKS